MKHRPYKFLVQAVVQQVDDNDTVVGEAVAKPVEVFGCDKLAEWAAAFPANLENAEIEPGSGLPQ